MEGRHFEAATVPRQPSKTRTMTRTSDLDFQQDTQTGPSPSSPPAKFLSQLQLHWNLDSHYVPLFISHEDPDEVA